MCCTSYESSNDGRGRRGQLSRNHRLNMQWSSPVCNTIFLLPSLTDIRKRPIRSRSHRRVSAAFGAHRGRSKAVVARAHVPLLQFAVRDRVCTTKIANCVDRGRSPSDIWWACSRQGERTSCRSSHQPRQQTETGFYNSWYYYYW